MKYSRAQREHFDVILDKLLAKTDGILDDLRYRRLLRRYLRIEAQHGNLKALVDMAADEASNRTIHQRRWEPNGTQATLFSADALLALGENEYVRMADARAAHLLRADAVLTANFRNQSDAYFPKHAYLMESMQALIGTDRTLGEIQS